MKSSNISESVVFIVAHPDDVANAMGGTAWLLREKYNLHVFCATRGQRGIAGKTPEEAPAASRHPPESTTQRRGKE